MSIRDRIKKFETLNQEEKPRNKQEDDSAVTQPGVMLFMFSDLIYLSTNVNREEILLSRHTRQASGGGTENTPVKIKTKLAFW